MQDYFFVAAEFYGIFIVHLTLHSFARQRESEANKWVLCYMYDILLPNVGRIVGPGIECRKEGSFIRSAALPSRPSSKLFSLLIRWIVARSWINCRVRYLSWCRMSDCENIKEIYTVKQARKIKIKACIVSAAKVLWRAVYAQCNAGYNAYAVTRDVTRDQSPILRTSDACARTRR